MKDMKGGDGMAVFIIHSLVHGLFWAGIILVAYDYIAKLI